MQEILLFMNNKAKIAMGLLAVMALMGLLGGQGIVEAVEKSAVAKFFCPMHPNYTSDRAGDCPICGMRLVAVKEGGAARPAVEGSTVAGRVSVMITPEKRQAIGVAFSTVEKRKLTRTLRVPGTAAHDETRLARISPRFGGWVRALQVNFTGQDVTEGQPLFTVYSPEVFTAENEYILAVRNSGRMTNSPAVVESKHLLDSARRRLELLGIGDEEIRRIEAGGQASDELQMRAPRSGHVTALNAVSGQSFMAGEALYEIAELGNLWMRAFVPEYELARVRVGQEARVIFPYLSNRTVSTEVAFINPHIDPRTRRGELRLNLPNAGHTLRPDMWADVELVTDSADLLSVPASAVIDTGTRFVAFVEGADSLLIPRELKLGVRTDDYYEVLEGAKEGERVVTRALFLVDSESQIKAAISGMEKEPAREGIGGGHSSLDGGGRRDAEPDSASGTRVGETNH